MTYFFAFLASVACFLLYLLTAALVRLADVQEKRLKVQIDNNSRMGVTVGKLGDAAASMMAVPSRNPGAN